MKPFPQTATLVKRTKKIQRRVTKYILDLPFRRDTNYEQRPLLLDVIPLCYWFEFLDILFFDKLIQGHVTIDNDSLPPPTNNNRRETRSLVPDYGGWSPPKLIVIF